MRKTQRLKNAKTIMTWINFADSVQTNILQILEEALVPVLVVQPVVRLDHVLGHILESVRLEVLERQRESVPVSQGLKGRLAVSDVELLRALADGEALHAQVQHHDEIVVAVRVAPQAGGEGQKSFAGAGLFASLLEVAHDGQHMRVEEHFVAEEARDLPGLAARHVVRHALDDERELPHRAAGQHLGAHPVHDAQVAFARGGGVAHNVALHAGRIVVQGRAYDFLEQRLGEQRRNHLQAGLWSARHLDLQSLQ